MHPFTIAAIQLTSGDDIATNIAAVEALIDKTAGASLICLPENAFFMRREGMAVAGDVPMAQHPGVLAMQKMAKTRSIWIAIGSIRALEAGMDKPFNRSVLIAPDGSIAAHYDKIHLFDVQLNTGEAPYSPSPIRGEDRRGGVDSQPSYPNSHMYRESSQVTAGKDAVLARTPLAAIGLSVCYDVRFPALYRALATAGADVLLVPSAFTKPTGAAHWHTLLRARAIENACYVVAAAQCGTHPGGRETYGHSLIIDPWGDILAEAYGAAPGIITATIDRARVAEVRAKIPVLAHQRPITSPAP